MAIIQTIFVTICGGSGNYDITVQDMYNSPEYYYSDGSFSYQGAGAIWVDAYDVNTGETLSFEPEDRFNVMINFSGGAPSSTVTIQNFVLGEWDATLYFLSNAPYTIMENGTFSFDDAVDSLYWYHYKSGKADYYTPSDRTNVVIDFNTLINTPPAETVTITVSGSPYGNTDIIITDGDGSEHYPSGNGIYTYEGLGVRNVYAWDHDIGEATTVNTSDPFNVIIIFGGIIPETKSSLVRIYKNGEWHSARAVVYKNGAWINVTPKTIKTT